MAKFLNFEDKFYSSIVRHRKTTIVLFVAVAVVCLVLMMMVSVNYNLSDYLPSGAESKKALNIMSDEFDSPMPNANVMIKDIGLTEALEYKEKIEKIDGVSYVMWLDDAVDLKVPLSLADQETVDMYYNDGDALFMVTVDSGVEVRVIDELYELIGPDNAISGDAADGANAQRLTSKETATAMAIAVPLILILLLLSTSSFAEPFFFFAAIGIAICMNMGSNIIMGEVSFLTQAIAPILQLAVSLDYAIFLLHSFNARRMETDNQEQAMIMALKDSFPTVAASAATTMFGFLALSFMEFAIGADMGSGLVRGVIFSFFSVMILFPCLVLQFYKIIDKTSHRNIMHKFTSLGKNILKARIPIFLIVILLLVPAYLAQSSSEFQYSMGNLGEGSRVGRDSTMVSKSFGDAKEVVILVPRGDQGREKLLTDELENLDYVRNIIGYTNSVGAEIPGEFPDSRDLEQFYSEDYSRIIVYVNTAGEGDIAFSVVENIREVTAKYYDEDSYVGGRTPTVFDMKEIITKDNFLVNMIAIIAIGLVIMITFKSLTLPILLVLTIETSIWINLSIPYFTSTPLSYIGYLICSTVQLGATVDYAILLASKYTAKRRIMPKIEAIAFAVNDSFNSILISAGILSMAGFSLAMTSSNAMVQEMGELLARGTIMSFIMVIFFLPSALSICDKIIDKTTWRSSFKYDKEVSLND